MNNNRFGLWVTSSACLTRDPTRVSCVALVARPALHWERCAAVSQLFGLGARAEESIPDGDDQFRVTDRERAGGFDSSDAGVPSVLPFWWR
jgi:hypothetical protein